MARVVLIIETDDLQFECELNEARKIYDKLHECFGPMGYWNSKITGRASSEMSAEEAQNARTGHDPTSVPLRGNFGSTIA